jgi:hypothetical protein
MAAALLAPWEAYRHWYDPPGNRLMRLHLAGVWTGRESDSLLQLLIDGYREAGLSGLLRNKLENVEVLWRENPAKFYYGCPPGVAAPWTWGDWQGLRRREFHNVLFALGALNLGWLPALWLLGWRGGARVGALVRWAFGMGVGGLALWILVMYGPGFTVAPHVPSTFYCLVAVGLGGALWWLAGRRRWLILGAQAAIFLWVWVITSPANSYGLPNIFTTCLALASAGGALRYTAIRDEKAEGIGVVAAFTTDLP